MSYENTGRLFKNDRKTAPNQPDYTGDFTDEHGTKLNCAAWVKPGKDGKSNWLSFRVTEFQQRQEPEPGEDTGGAF